MQDARILRVSSAIERSAAVSRNQITNAIAKPASAGSKRQWIWVGRRYLRALASICLHLRYPLASLRDPIGFVSTPAVCAGAQGRKNLPQMNADGAVLLASPGPSKGLARTSLRAATISTIGNADGTRAGSRAASCWRTLPQQGFWSDAVSAELGSRHPLLFQRRCFRLRTEQAQVVFWRDSSRKRLMKNMHVRIPTRDWMKLRATRGRYVSTPPPNLGPLRGPSPQGEGESAAESSAVIGLRLRAWSVCGS